MWTGIKNHMAIKSDKKSLWGMQRTCKMTGWGRNKRGATGRGVCRVLIYMLKFAWVNVSCITRSGKTWWVMICDDESWEVLSLVLMAILLWIFDIAPAEVTTHFLFGNSLQDRSGDMWGLDSFRYFALLPESNGCNKRANIDLKRSRRSKRN